MTSSVDPLDRLVGDYLDQVSHAAADLPAARREDLLADLIEHITVARAESAPTEAAVRTILDNLGRPTTIVEAARAAEPNPLEPAGTGYPPSRQSTSPAEPPAAVQALLAVWNRAPVAVTAILVVGLIVVVLTVAAVIIGLQPAPPPPEVVR